MKKIVSNAEIFRRFPHFTQNEVVPLHTNSIDFMIESAPSIHIKENFDSIMNLVTDNNLHGFIIAQQKPVLRPMKKEGGNAAPSPRI